MRRVYLVTNGTGTGKTLVSVTPTVEQAVDDLLAQKASDDPVITEYDFDEPNTHVPEHIRQEVERKRI